jgi:DNA-binding XRE family transcriptional regulator
MEDEALVAPTEAGARFRDERARLRMSQAELARWLGVDRTTVSRWETEGPPRVAALALAYVLSVTPGLTRTVSRNYAKTLT